MALTLTVRSGTAPVPSLTLDQSKVLLGRGPGSDLVLPDPSVSHQHASIRQRGSEYIVLDEGSTNGTHVGPVRLSEGTPRVLATGDLIRLGRVWIEVTIEQAIASPNHKDLTKEIALCLIEGGLRSEGEPAVPRLLGRGDVPEKPILALERFSVPYVIGRGKNCDLTLADEDCSRRHVEVVRRGLGIWVRDLGSKNGAKLDGTPLGAELVAMTAGAVLSLGKTELVLEDPLTDVLHEIEALRDELVVGEVDLPSGTERSPGTKGKSRPRPTATVAEVQKRESAGSVSKPRRAPIVVDLFILLLALLVLAFSAAGLYWLL
jgi:pSer/pThr/pTyr-binding forkhead associated (FHA) protein